MADRVVVFVDYQNAYRAARNAFHDHLTDPHWAGQIHPTALGALITRLSGDPDRVLHQVRMYRGLPSSAKDPKGYGAARRQIAAWNKLPHVAVTARPLRYPRDYPASKPEEKGIDVQIALDFAMMAVRGEYDVGVLMSGDTDLLPALEEVIRLNSQPLRLPRGGHQPVKDADSASRTHASTVTGSTITPTPPSRTTPTTRHADQSATRHFEGIQYKAPSTRCP